MEDVTFGMWSAHKEGQFDTCYNKVFSYCDNNGKETMRYPDNLKVLKVVLVYVLIMADI